MADSKTLIQKLKANGKDIAYVLTLLTGGGFLTHEKLKPQADDETIQQVVVGEHEHSKEISDIKAFVKFQGELLEEVIVFRDKYWAMWDSPEAVEQRRKEANAVEIAEENKREIARLHPRR